MSGAVLRPEAFETTEAWVFDLDNTLYPADCNLFSQIDKRMDGFIRERFGLPQDEAHALRKHYYYTYGTTLAGLMKMHGTPPDDFLDYVHDIDLSVVQESPMLSASLKALPGKKYVFTNGSGVHAERVMARLGVTDLFDDVFDIRAADFVPKPERATYERFLKRNALQPGMAAMFDDLPHNLKTAHSLGMVTVLVSSGVTDHPEHQAIAGWDELPGHIHHHTETLVDFLETIVASKTLAPRKVASARSTLAAGQQGR